MLSRKGGKQKANYYFFFIYINEENNFQQEKGYRRSGSPSFFSYEKISSTFPD
jgi:hypothetical protein